MKERAYAKINLSIDVVQKLENGYHELDMIMVPLDFYDVVEIEIADEMSFESNIKFLVMDSKNTIIQAIEVLREECGFSENFRIHLTKHIPTQAGLAGGSSDAAAALKLVKKLLKLNISEEKMLQLAKKVGADVPFCYYSSPAVVKGIGEQIELIDIESDYYVFLAKPKKGVSTKIAFSKINFETLYHPNIEQVKQDLINNDYDGICRNIGNSLEESSFSIVPSIQLLKNNLFHYGFDVALMSGSGSTVFALTKDKSLMDKAAIDFRKQGYFVRKTKTLI